MRLCKQSPLLTTIRLLPIEDVPVCFAEIIYKYSSSQKQEQTRLSTGDTLFTVEGWKSIPSHVFMKWKKPQRLLMRIWFIIFQSMEVTPIKLHSRPYKSLSQFYVRKHWAVVGKSPSPITKNRPRDVSAEETLRIYEEFLSDVAKSPCFCQHFTLRKPKK